jgi:hypothetical protein
MRLTWRMPRNSPLRFLRRNKCVECKWLAAHRAASHSHDSHLPLVRNMPVAHLDQRNSAGVPVVLSTITHVSRPPACSAAQPSMGSPRSGVQPLCLRQGVTEGNAPSPKCAPRSAPMTLPCHRCKDRRSAVGLSRQPAAIEVPNECPIMLGAGRQASNFSLRRSCLW